MRHDHLIGWMADTGSIPLKDRESDAKLSNLPIVQLTKVELMINLRTAKALGLMIPVDAAAGGSGDPVAQRASRPCWCAA